MRSPKGKYRPGPDKVPTHPADPSAPMFFVIRAFATLAVMNIVIAALQIAGGGSASWAAYLAAVFALFSAAMLAGHLGAGKLAALRMARMRRELDIPEEW